MSLRFVVLDCVYDIWDHPIVSELFSEIVSLKRHGYQKAYGPDTLANGEIDFIGTHNLICDEIHGKLVPLMGYLSITRERAKRFKVPFPALSLVQANGGADHVTVVRSIIDACEKEGTSLSYESLWTIDPALVRDKVLYKKLHALFKAQQVLYLTQYKIEQSILGGAIRFGVDNLFRLWGYEPLRLNGSALPPIRVARAGGAPTLMLHVKQISADALAFAEQYREMWENRIVIDADTCQLIKRVA